MGNVAATATWDNPPGWSVMATSFFDVFFEVDIAGSYTFSASVNWTGSADLIGEARVEIQDATVLMSPTPILSPLTKSDSDQGSAMLGPTVIALTPGIDYRVFARSVISGGGGTDVTGASAMGHWEFSLTAVPEISGFVAMTPLALVAAYCSWRHRRSKRQTTNAG
jgi:hypothetical protein